MLFWLVGEPFGVVNDITTVIIATSMIPLAAFLYELNRANFSTFAFVALLAGMLSMLVAALLQAMLVLRLVSLEFTLTAVPAAFGIVGVWLLLNSLLGRSTHLFPVTLVWLGILAAVGYVLVIVGFIIGGQQHPLTAIGGLAAVVCYPAWSIWLGRLLLTGKLTL